MRGDGKLAEYLNPDASTGWEATGAGQHRLTPSNASHTYSIRGTRVSSNATVVAGAGGSGNAMPGFIRITRVTS